MINEPIDAVVLWVDGSDPRHHEKREKYKKENQKNAMACGTLDWRFLDAGEVKYCIYSIRRFAPWIRNIYLVTDEQCPDWLNADVKSKLNVKLIDHSVIFRDHLNLLPTFNSISIESLLWKIPDISNKYILFNDDVLLLRPIKANDFFIEEKTIIRGIWRLQKDSIWKFLKRVIKKYALNKDQDKPTIKHYNPYANAARIIGYRKKYVEPAHVPHPFRKDIQQAFYEANPGLLQHNVKYRFRNKEQFGAPPLFYHLAIKQNKAIEHNAHDSETIIPQYGGLKNQRSKFDALKNSENPIKFLCFQDLAFLKEQNPKEFHEVEEYFKKTILNK